MYVYGPEINSINDSTSAMSTTALVSAFYDVRDVLYQNRKNDNVKTQCMHERRATIGASMNVTKNRNISTGSFIPVQQAQQQQSQHTAAITPASLISCGDISREHRKLDRSMSEPVGERNQNNLNNNVRSINSSRYKTELCRPFEENGTCKYGDKCQFAHGMPEMRSLSRHPKYKTELCRTYHTIGFCPYGHRCHFIHNEDERKILEAQQAHAAMLAGRTTGGRQSPLNQDSHLKRPCSFNSSFNGSLGSTADSPPSSASESPSLSPTLFVEENYNNMCNPTSIGSNSSSMSSSPVFNYSSSPDAFTSLLAPLNVQTQQVNHNNGPDLHVLHQQFNTILNLNQQNNNPCVFRDTDVAPPSPPDSISGDSVGSNSSTGSYSTNTCGTALDLSKSLRLPIFNRLSQD